MSLAGMFVFCAITLLLLRTDQILSKKNYFVGSARVVDSSTRNEPTNGFEG